MVVLGTGDGYYEDMFRTLLNILKLSANIRFDNTLIASMPGQTLLRYRYRTVWLSQLIAMRYVACPLSGKPAVL